MAYERNTLVSRSSYSGMGDIWDSITGAAGSVLKFYGSQQQAQGAAAAAAQSNKDLAAALAARSGGLDTTTLLLIGGLGIGAVLLLRKKD